MLTLSYCYRMIHARFKITSGERSGNAKGDVMASERISYPVSEAAVAVGRSRYVLYDAIRRNELVAYQQSEDSDYLVLAEDLRAWVTRMPAQHQSRRRSRK